MKVLLDTNVLISGLLSPRGLCADILRLMINCKINLLVDARILDEYKEVMLRPKFAFSFYQVEAILNFIEANAEWVLPVPLGLALPDADDAPFVEVAIAGKANAIVTGNLKHYPETLLKKINIVSPAEFMKFFNKEG